jgi:1-acyl-sn-glycerol-3-phosphate acyltransferase
MRLLFNSVGRIYVLHREKAEQAGPFLLGGNHISHFDPFIISGILTRKIDWMTMAEFFPYPVLGQFLRAVDAFPAERNRANRATIQTALERLKRGHAIGIFPEGGIRDGEKSILAGATLRSGVSALADMSGAAVVPCVILGSDRLYNKKRWLPFRRTPIWVAFGDAIRNRGHGSKRERRHAFEQDFVRALQRLYHELRDTFCLSVDDLPRTPRQRMLE